MIEFRLPSLGADMDEGMLVAWRVAPGDHVDRGQVVAEVESDKGIIEVECWEEGVVAELLVQPGPERLAVGTPLARLAAGEPASVAPESATAPATTPRRSRRPKQPRAARTAPPATPPVRHLAHELGIDLGDVVPSGPAGTITRDDLMRLAPRPPVDAPPTTRSETPPPTRVPPPGRTRATPLARRLAAERGIDLAGTRPTRKDGILTSADLAASPEAPAPVEPESKVEAMRRAIARSMARSKRDIPHYYLGTHLDLATATRWLDAHNEERSITHRLLPAVLLLKATALALRQVPELNGHYLDDGFHPAADVHLGVAVSLREGGLVAPAIHDADRLSLDELMEALRDLVGRARTWRLRSSEMSDPTITVTNLGDRGVETAFPVIIPPQVAIVGFGKVADRPVAIEGMLAVHPTVYASLAADHRVSDGHRGGLFLDALDTLLQEPNRL